VPETEVVFYQDDDGTMPVLDWLRKLQARQRPAFAKCVARILRLAALGYKLRRPECDMLRGGVYELRARHRRTNYRIMYFFHGQNVAILAHAITKEGKVPQKEIDRAIERKVRFETAPDIYSALVDLQDG
jgi:phage-related protein